MVRELASIVRSDRLYLRGQWPQELADGLFDSLRRIALHLLQERQSRLAFHEADDSLVLVLADDRVRFPITDAPSGLDHLGALFDAHPLRDVASAVVRAIAFAPLLLAAEMMMEVSARRLVSVDMLIDALMAETDPPLAPEMAGDLFRTPVLSH